jgi:hypothetical protein
MSYIVYNKATTKILKKKNGMNAYGSEAAAKAGLTRSATCYGIRHPAYIRNKDDYAIAEAKHFYEHIEKKETVINLMSGKPVIQSVNTPLCCDVSSETYWSM